MAYYKNIRTKFVKEKIKGKSFKDEEFKDYIESLIRLEGFVAEGPKCLASGYMFNNYTHVFKKEYEAIKDELCPGWRKEAAEREKEERKKKMLEEKKEREQERIRLREEKKEWLELGGKL